MAKTSVFKPFFDDDAQTSVNFFNGRLLSAEDLTTEKRADRAERRRLGKAIGDGVVYGLHVSDATSGTETPQALRVSAGVAIDRTGESIALPNETDVSLLTGAAKAAGEPNVEPFTSCMPPQAGGTRAGTGLYLLTIKRSTGATGLAPVSGLGGGGAGCNRKYLVEGVTFSLIPVPADALLADPAHLRNRAAYACFGTTAFGRIPADALGAEAADDSLTTLRSRTALGICEVPLALIYWTSTGGIRFIDEWAVRRRPAALQPAGAPWQNTLDPAFNVEAEARLRQFQRHVASLVSGSGAPQQIVARDHFTYLPPVAFLPITGVRVEDRRLRPVVGSARLALDYERFFGGRVRGEPLFIEGARIGALVGESLGCPPIELEGEQMFRLYVVRENVQAVEGGGSAAPYMIVASPHMRFHADARFVVSQWNYSNYV